MKGPGPALRARWVAVNAIQDEELRRLSPDDRFDQLLGLFELRPFVNADPWADAELAAVRRRWAELHRRYLASR